MLRPLIVVALAGALLLPVLFRRQRRRAGLRAGALTPKFRKRLVVTMVLSVLMLVVGLVGIAGADNGDATGSHPGTSKTEINAIVAPGVSRDATDRAQSA